MECIAVVHMLVQAATRPDLLFMYLTHQLLAERSITVFFLLSARASIWRCINCINFDFELVWHL